jgi:hypothetical protein
MLQALRRRKAQWLVSESASQAPIGDGGDTTEESSERELEQGYRLNEDTLTAMVFGRLCYLPSDTFWRLLSNACTPRLGIADGIIRERLFWPTLPLRVKGSDSQRSQPDLIIGSSTFDLILEAKRRDGSDLQNPVQLAKEWLAWSQQPAQQRSQNGIVIAVGGFGRITEAAIAAFHAQIAAEIAAMGGKNNDLAFHAIAWSSLRQQVEDERGRAAANERFVFEDLIAAFELHELLWRAPVWLADFPDEIRPIAPLDQSASEVLNAFEAREISHRSPRWFGDLPGETASITPIDLNSAVVLSAGGSVK